MWNLNAKIVTKLSVMDVVRQKTTEFAAINPSCHFHLVYAPCMIVLRTQIVIKSMVTANVLSVFVTVRINLKVYLDQNFCSFHLLLIGDRLLSIYNKHCTISMILFHDITVKIQDLFLIKELLKINVPVWYWR